MLWHFCHTVLVQMVMIVRVSEGWPGNEGGLDCGQSEAAGEPACVVQGISTKGTVTVVFTSSGSPLVLKGLYFHFLTASMVAS